MARRKVDTARGVRGTRRRNTGNNNGQTKSDPALNEALGKAAAHSLMTNDDSLQQILGRTLRENGMNPNDVFNNRGGMNRYQPAFDNWGSPPDTGAGVGGRTLQNGGPNVGSDFQRVMPGHGTNPHAVGWTNPELRDFPGNVDNGGPGMGPNPFRDINPGGTIHNHGGTRHDHQGGGPGHKHDGQQLPNTAPNGDPWNPPGPQGGPGTNWPNPNVPHSQPMQRPGGGGNGGGQGGGGGQPPAFDPSQFSRGDARPYDPSQLLGNGNNAYTPDMTNQQVRAQWGPQGFGLNGQPGYQNAYGQPQTQPMQGGGGQPTPHSHGGQPHAHPQGDQPHGHGQGGAGGGGGGQGGQAGGGGQGGGAGGGGQDGGPWATQNPDGTWSYPSPDAHMPGTNFTPVPGAGTPMTSEPSSLTSAPPGSYPWAGKGYMAPPSNMTYYNPGVGGFAGQQAPSSAPVSFATADQLAQQYGLQLGLGTPPNQLPNPSGGTQPGWANPAPPGPDIYDPWIESRLIGNAYKPTAGNLGGFTQAYLQAAGGDNAYTRLALQQYLAHKAGYQGYGTMTDALPYGYVAPHG